MRKTASLPRPRKVSMNLRNGDFDLGIVLDNKIKFIDILWERFGWKHYSGRLDNLVLIHPKKITLRFRR